MIGFIGGSGVYKLEKLEGIIEKKIDTPFGQPSDAFICGRIGERKVCFLPRHGRDHQILPSEINHRANVFGFKCLGVARLISISAVGSLREELRPRDIVLPDQYYDRSKKSGEHSFFGSGIVAHISLAQPACPTLRQLILQTAKAIVTNHKQDIRVISGGTYVHIEGPAFSTKAESIIYQKFGFDIIGMTSMPEAKLCREAEICYQALAMITDYDCWNPKEDNVSVEMVIEHIIENTKIAKKIVSSLAQNLPEKFHCSCQHSLDGAILTNPSSIPTDTKNMLMPIIGKYLCPRAKIL